MLVEIIATNLEEAILAEKYGASRIELIHGFELGGLSPNKELIKRVCDAVRIPVNVMVRPHGSSFVFSDQDMQQVYEEINFIASNTAANAIVFGTLDQRGAINFTQLESVLKFIEDSNLQLTFHRAIDESCDLLTNFKQLVKSFSSSKLTKILTSGGKSTAVEGSDTISTMVDIASTTDISILAGAGINPNNAKSLIQSTNVTEIHLGTGVRTSFGLDDKLFKQLFNNLA